MLALLAAVVVALGATAVWLVHDRRRLMRLIDEAEAQRLRSELDPRFLHNVLLSISEAGHTDAGAAERVLQRLIALLRKSLDGVRVNEIALRDEVAFLENYLDIEKALRRDQLQFQLSFDADVLNARVPSMILLPLVENAIAHGRGKDGIARLVVKGMRGGDNLIIAIADGGPGLRSGLELGTGIGNTRERLLRLYGSAARLKLLEPPTGGLMAQLVIPFHDGEAIRQDRNLVR